MTPLQTLYLVCLVVGAIAFILGCYLAAWSHHRVVMAEFATSYLLSHPIRRLVEWERDIDELDADESEWPDWHDQDWPELPSD